MNQKWPVCTLLSLFACVGCFFISIPILAYSVNKQVSEEFYNSADAQEDAGRMSGFAVIGGAFLFGTLGAAGGLILLVVAHWRREHAPIMGNFALVINFVALFIGLKAAWPLIT